MKSVFVKRAVISSLLALVISSSSQAATEQRISLFTSPTIGADFVLIPAGTFTMGDSANTHRVTISKPFFMQTTEVTQGQWQTVMGSNPSRFKDCGDDCPVEQVSWNDVQDFIGKLNSMEGPDKYRLPTEAEWEYAARSGGKQETYAGTSSESEFGNYAWYSANSGRKTHPVGQKIANGLGLYDMSGNVWEWVLDWYGEYQSGLFSLLLSVTDPTGPSSGSQRVLRGGSWYNAALYCRAAFRRYYNPDIRSSNLGFRLVNTP
jgi:formylglycine-generating enzyme required for sulfatase activity